MTVLEEGSRPISFRLSAEEYREAKRIAQMASGHGKIKNDSVSTLAKACLFVRINEWRQIEYQQEAERLRDEALKARGVAPQGYSNV